jgi:hypothetical protein
MGDYNGVNDDLEYLTKRYVRDFFKFIGEQREWSEEPSKTRAVKLADVLGENTVDFIRDGYARTIYDALSYQLQKTNLTTNKDNVLQIQAQRSVLERLKEYNNGNDRVKRVFDIYSVTAGDPDGDTLIEKNNLTFSEADLLFDSLKGQKDYPVILLDEGDIIIRGQGPNRGEEREIRYDVINSLTRKLDRLETVTYKPIPVQDSYIFHIDPGHAWLEVPLQEIVDLGLKDKITPYSYAAGDKAYLEEDLDAGTFLEMRKRMNKSFEIHDRFFDGESPIRNLPHYQSQFITVKSSREQVKRIQYTEMSQNQSAGKKNKEDIGLER